VTQMANWCSKKDKSHFAVITLL